MLYIKISYCSQIRLIHLKIAHFLLLIEQTSIATSQTARQNEHRRFEVVLRKRVFRFYKIQKLKAV